MLIYGVAASPFCRKIWISTIVAGLEGKVSLVPVDLSSREDLALLSNPLGKVPVLITGDGQSIFDSPVIVDFLDILSGGRLLPKEGQRFSALKGQALADGILQAAMNQVMERRFHEDGAVSAKWIAFQSGKVKRGLAALEAAPPALANDKIAIDAIATACLLGYLDTRFDGEWRQNHKRLEGFLEEFATRCPAFQSTGAATVFGERSDG